MRESSRKPGIAILAAIVLLLALPALCVHGWMAATFPPYAHGAFGQGLVFTLAWCALLVLIARWRLLGVVSWPAAWLLYLVWLFLVLGEGVSYSLQAETFNARFFAHLDPSNLTTGLRAFPLMIGGGVAVFVAMAAACAWLFHRLSRPRLAMAGRPRPAAKAIVIVVLLLLCLGLDSAPRRLGIYLVRLNEAAHFADTPAGRAIAEKLDLHPTSLKGLIAAPGKNVVIIYMESLERQFWDPSIYPGLTPNLDRLRKTGLDFSGFETFSGANYTMAGLFSSQCGAPLFTSPFSGLDSIAGNTTDRETFHPKLVCLGDVLRSAGYSQIYLGGAPIEFSNKGLFFQLHGYDQALGLKQLEAEAGGTLPESGWGLYDSELFRIALTHYRKFEAAGQPFNLSMLTLDTHPPDGRPSPGCPKYAGSNNPMLQAVHCTDSLVGKFVGALAREPDWKDTVVLIMSDHLAMRNDAEALYPKDYHRQPALLVLNAGYGVRPVRMYHIDIAPTLLDLMGVRSNASFIAGESRAAPDAEASQLLDDDVTDAVLRKALWSRANEFSLCKKGKLVGWTNDSGFEVGGRELKMSYRGDPAVGIHSGQVLNFLIDNANANLIVADAEQQSSVLESRGDASVLTIRLLPAAERKAGALFSVDWLGRKGATAHIADVPRLRGLTITSRDCSSLLHQADAAGAQTRLDFSRSFHAVTASPPVIPVASVKVAFTDMGVRPFERGAGWMWPQGWGSYASGQIAALEFRLPEGKCQGAFLHMTLDPYLPPSRPVLDTQVWVDGELATTWHFKAPPVQANSEQPTSDDHGVLQVSAPLGDLRGACDAQIELRFVRPAPLPATVPAGEDPRPLQMRVVSMWVDAVPGPPVP